MYSGMGGKSYCSTSTNNNAPLFSRIGGSFKTRNTKNCEIQIELKKIFSYVIFYINNINKI